MIAKGWRLFTDAKVWRLGRRCCFCAVLNAEAAEAKLKKRPAPKSRCEEI
jgi:hypothetical protein